jgi:glycosyltransferase involved in cell wall biosynthesis
VRILYVASDQRVPGRTGGSVHVLEVARGLAARGHEVHAVVHRVDGTPQVETDGRVTWHRVAWRPDVRLLRFRARRAVAAVASASPPDIVIERYYNFGGEGSTVAEALGVPFILEVNSPVVDHPGSLKAALDAAALFRPMRMWREHLCRKAAALMAPIPGIVPAFARDKTEIVTWGANVDAFHPDLRSEETRRAFGAPEGATVAIFIGSFRPWHGVHVFEEAARRLRDRKDVYCLLVGEAGRGAEGYHGRRVAAMPYESMPPIVASADVGVAPYDPARLRQLRLGFYWSPLKIFEYMASGLPTVTIPREPLTEIVREGIEGLHVAEGDADGLARAIERLADDRALRVGMGSSARRRVVERYSWARHCEQVEDVLRRCLA